MRRVALISAVAVILACGRETPRPVAGSSDSTTASTGEAGCDLLRSAANPDPFDLVQEYVRRDGAGELVGGGRNPWLDTALACPGRVALVDSITVVAGYSFRAIAQDAERARMLVTYILVGDVRQSDSAAVLHRRVGTQRDTFTAAQTAFGWRIDARARHMVLAGPALSHVGPRLPEPDRQFLSGIAARRRPE